MSDRRVIVNDNVWEDVEWSLPTVRRCTAIMI
jgi:hypothetical protein